MKKKLMSMLKNWRVIVLLVFLVCSLIMIRPVLDSEGVAIRSIEKDSAAYLADMQSPNARDKPMMREIITKVNGIKVIDTQHYSELTSDLAIGDIVRIETLSNYEKTEYGRDHSFFKQPKVYTLTVIPETITIMLNETEDIIVQEIVPVNETINGTVVEVNETINKTVTVNKTVEEIIGIQDLGIKIYDTPTSNIKKGLDLEGGTRVMLKPEEEVSEADMDIVIENLKQRLNVYGLSDIVVRISSDLEGNQYILIEIAGATEDEVKELIGGQGKFEAKIGEDVVFAGGEDVKFVCRSADCSFASDPRRPCTGAGEEYYCTFSFSITLSTDAAEAQAEQTMDLMVIDENGYQYLNESLDLYLDDELVDSLRIGADLKGKASTQISISGPGYGRSYQEALMNSALNMKQLQTVLITGSLPVKLETVKIDTISPLLGQEFIKNILFVGAFAILAVAIVIYIRFRTLFISLPVMFTMLCEILLLLGLAALIGWNLDLAAIAGILIAVGTGVDHQIVIADEVLRKGKASASLNWKDKIKSAFFIIMAAYFTTCVAMIPLLWAGAGLVKGFAITTILGVTIGVFVTRPAFAAIVEILLRD